MENASIQGVTSLLRRYGLHPKKGLGQNFLVDKNILRKIVDGCGPTSADAVLEIGTGLGALTLMLAEQAGQVITVEIDNRLLPVIQEVFQEQPRVRLVQGDILKVDWEKDLQPVPPYNKYLICANLPYYITSPIIFEILKHHYMIEHAVLMMQKEVADRLLAQPGTKEYGLLTVMVAWRADVQPVTKVSRNCFYPVPDVDSRVIKLIPLKEPRVQLKNDELFVKIVREAFQKRRKTMTNVLSGIEGVSREQAPIILSGLNIDPQRRGETLTVDDFARIANKLC
ncbi:MAG: 16S rRNA (adenine(1518)-N(6)/adenine(1519)-N(6))-dimethyltransferase RsmA [Acidobacteriota bacterium]